MDGGIDDVSVDKPKHFDNSLTIERGVSPSNPFYFNSKSTMVRNLNSELLQVQRWVMLLHFVAVLNCMASLSNESKANTANIDP